jgi:hypothetical protein
VSLIYVSDMGFDSPLQRFELILTAAEKDPGAVDRWLAEDGSKAGLQAIIQRKRPVRQTHEEDGE